MRPDRHRLQLLSQETGFGIGALEKVFRLVELLEDIAKHPYLPKRLALKGGTVINLCFGPPRRLSVDLDFNYVGAESRDRMLEERPEVERAMETVAGARGYRIQRSSDAHSGRKLFLGYQNVMNARDRLEIDLNYLFRLPLEATEERPSRERLIAGAWAILEPLLNLDGVARRYCDRLNAGELRPDLLFVDDTATADLLSRHPALLWKAHNARRRGE